MNGEIVFPSRPFRDVHQLVFLVQSWQLLVDASELPASLQPLREIPVHLGPVVGRALREARDQLDASEDGTEIALRLPATDELVELLRWAASRLDDSLSGSSTLDPAWGAAIALARDLVGAALAQVATPADELA